MDEQEYWLLDFVVTMQYPLDALVDENFEVAFNRPPHQLSQKEKMEVLLRMFKNGDLVAELMDLETFTQLRKLIPTPQEIEAAWGGELSLFYGLTAQGGGRWEVYSKPDWNRYINIGYGIDEDEEGLSEGQISGSDRQTVEQYLSLLYDRYLMDLVTVNAGSEIWEEEAPWQATYWKILPVGHHVRFKFHWELEQEVRLRRKVQQRPPWIDEWLTNIGNWYTKYAGE